MIIIVFNYISIVNSMKNSSYEITEWEIIVKFLLSIYADKDKDLCMTNTEMHCTLTWPLLYSMSCLSSGHSCTDGHLILFLIISKVLGSFTVLDLGLWQCFFAIFMSLFFFLWICHVSLRSVILDKASVHWLTLIPPPKITHISQWDV